MIDFGRTIGKATAFQTTQKNRFSVWNRTVKAGHLAPECWPEIVPGYQISANASVFTIGSCFARNIEGHLRQAGIEVIGRLPETGSGRIWDSGLNWLNKFSPSLIAQEVEWARTVRQDGGVVTENNTAACMFYVRSDGQVMDQGLNVM